LVHLDINVSDLFNLNIWLALLQLPYVVRAPVLLQTIQRQLQRSDVFSPTLMAHLED